MNPRLTRQELLRRSAAGGALLAFPSLLAACGGGGGGGSSDGGELNDVLNFGNWPFYIDTPQSLKAAGVTAPTRMPSRSCEGLGAGGHCLETSVLIPVRSRA